MRVEFRPGHGMRQIVLDTETTGIAVEQGHRIIEVGCIEVVNRRATGNHFRRFVNPERKVDEGAVRVHGITDEFLADKPLFVDIAQDLWDWLAGDELIIHNAAFDVGFLDAEFARCKVGKPLAEVCKITDTVAMARKLHPGQKASLDALCRRYEVDNSRRDYHGALLDAQLLADVYLAMTGGQSALTLDSRQGKGRRGALAWEKRLGVQGMPLNVRRATVDEQAAHQQRLAAMNQRSPVIWSSDLPEDALNKA